MFAVQLDKHAFTVQMEPWLPETSVNTARETAAPSAEEQTLDVQWALLQGLGILNDIYNPTWKPV